METIQTHPLPQYRIAKTVVLGDLTIARRAREVLLDNCELEPIVVFSHEKTPISWCPTYWGQFNVGLFYVRHFDGAKHLRQDPKQEIRIHFLSFGW
jgi:hypothetical protein